MHPPRPCRSSSAPAWVIAVPLLAAGCGGKAEPEPEAKAPPAIAPVPRPKTAPAAAAAPAPAAGVLPRRGRIWQPEELPEFIGPVLPALDEASRKESEHKSAANDDWPLEALHDEILPHLQRFLAAVLADDEAALTALIRSPDFQGAVAARPAPLFVRFDGPAARVLEAEAAALAGGPKLDAAAFAASTGALREALGATAARSAAPLIVSLETPSAERAATRVLVQLDGGAPDAPVQINATWSVAWSLAPGSPPRVVGLEILRHQEVHAAAPFLVDASGAAFAAVPAWESEFLRGLDEYFMRIDRRAGLSFQGMQGLAVGDIDNDGLEDVYVCAQVGLPNRLFVRNADGTVSDRSGTAKVDYLDVTRSALIVDLDNDGNRDLVLAVGNAIVAAYNDGKGVFSRQQRFDAEGAEQFYSICAADPDGDGDLDIYGCRYALGGVMQGAPSPYHDANNGAPNVYLRNEGGGFREATVESGLDVNNRRFSLAALWEDIDGDGDLDLYVVNDFGRKNLYVNDGTGHFEDRAAQHGLEDIGAGMGISGADYDLDGDLDLYVTDMFSAVGLRTASQERFLGGRHPQARPHYVKHARGNALLRNRGDGTFDDVSEASGTALGRWAWGSKFVDFDSDGYADIYVPNGQTTSRKQPEDLEGFFWRRVINQSPVDPSTQAAYRTAFDAIQNLMMFGFHSWNGNERNNAYLNLGDGTFAEVSHASGAGFVQDSRAVALVDWDDDGREDILLKSRTAPRLRLLLSRGRTTHRFASFELIGRSCNRDAIGALVTLTVDGRPRSKRVIAGDGYLAQSSTRLIFGLGQAEKIERVDVAWPDGKRTSYTDLAVDSRYRIDQAADAPAILPARPAAAVAGTSFPPNEGSLAPVDRVVLADRMPLAPFELPTTNGPSRRIRDFAGHMLLLHVWTGAHASGTAALSELAAAAPALAERDVRVVCLTNDEGPALARAIKTIAATPFAKDAGYVDGRTREALKILAIEFLGYFDRVPLPLSLLIDRQGRACVLYLGPVDPAQVAADAQTLGSLKPRQGSTQRLAGGRWLVHPRRDLGSIAKIFTATGFEDLAAYLEEVIRKREAAASTQEQEQD